MFLFVSVSLLQNTNVNRGHTSSLIPNNIKITHTSYCTVKETKVFVKPRSLSDSRRRLLPGEWRGRIAGEELAD